MTDETETNIEPSATTFVGRNREVEALREHFREGHRLITILGTAGTGKTRLAQETGLRSVDRFAEGGVWFCDLSQADDAEDVAAEVAATLGIDLEDTASLKERRDRIGRTLAARGRLLVILDNFEQISDSSESLIRPWLDATDESVFLVTSRERLRLADEFCLDLDPLSPEDAVDLFEARAGMAASNFEVTEELYETVETLVRHLDHLPLAIELAASRIRALPPNEMLERISSRFRILRSPHRDLEPRQKTLEQAIEWSWEMLDEPERCCLSQCSVFRGGFSVDLAEEILDLSSEDRNPWVVDVLERLIDKSVLERESGLGEERAPRISMFESIREFVERHVEEFVDPVALAERHARSFAARGEEWVEQLDGGEAGRHLQRLRDEQANLWAAFERHRDRRPALAFRIASVLQRFLRYGGSGEKHRAVVRYMTEYAQKRSQKSSQVSTYRARAELRSYRGNLRGALDDFRRALDLFKRVDRPGLRSELLGKVGELERILGEPLRAVENLERGIELAREASRPATVRKLNALLACAHADAGNLDATLDSVGQARTFESGGNLRDECRTLNRLAYAHFYLENYERQRALQERALEVAREIGDDRLEGECIQGLGDAAYARRDYERAVALYEEALQRHRTLGNRHAEGVVYGNSGAAFHRQDDLEEAVTCYERAISIHEETGAIPYRAAALHGLGVARHEQSQFDEARRRLGQASELWDSIDAAVDAAGVRMCAALTELRDGATGAAAETAEEAHRRLESEGPPAMAALGGVLAAVSRSADGESDVELRNVVERAAEIIGSEDATMVAMLRALSARLFETESELRVGAGTDSDGSNEDALGNRLFGRALRSVPETEWTFEVDGDEPAPPDPSGAEATLRVGPEARWFVLDGHEPVDLSRRGAIRRILDALVEASGADDRKSYDVYDLFDIGWPDDDIAPDQASNRVYWAVSKIRDLGFEDYLVTTDDGYHLDSSALAIRRSEREQPR